MKIEFEDTGIELSTEDILERLYLERLGLKHKGDVAKCVVMYQGTYIILKIVKAEEGNVKDRIKEK